MGPAPQPCLPIAVRLCLGGGLCRRSRRRQRTPRPGPFRDLQPTPHTLATSPFPSVPPAPRPEREQGPGSAAHTGGRELTLHPPVAPGLAGCWPSVGPADRTGFGHRPPDGAAGWRQLALGRLPQTLCTDAELPGPGGFLTTSVPLQGLPFPVWLLDTNTHTCCRHRVQMSR